MKDAVNRRPFMKNAENIRAGQECFSHYCLVCHGLDGQNTGVPLRRSHVTARVSAELARGTAVHGWAAEVVVDNGIVPSGMSASKGILNEDDIWQIVDSIHPCRRKRVWGTRLCMQGINGLGALGSSKPLGKAASGCAPRPDYSTLPESALSYIERTMMGVFSFLLSRVSVSASCFPAPVIS